MIECPLCDSSLLLETVKGPDARGYRRCVNCSLLFVEPHFLLSKEEEKKQYLTHNNGIEHQGYVAFLNQAVEPALPLLYPNMHGLDFGCGPVPTLSIMLRQHGFVCDDYDPIFFPELPTKTFDFIFATECFEHFFSPAKEIANIANLLNPQGYIIIMTETWTSVDAFKTWRYAKDDTHVSFFHNRTFEFIAQMFNFKCIETNNCRVKIFKKI